MYLALFVEHTGFQLYVRNFVLCSEIIPLIMRLPNSQLNGMSSNKLD